MTLRESFLIIPMYNEEKRFNVSYFIDVITNARQIGWIVCFVNDGSSDNTSELLNSFAKENECSVLQLDSNVGKSNAVRLAMCSLLESFPNAKYIGFLDGDGAFSIQDILFLTENVFDSKSDIWIGSRISLAGSKIERRATRHLIGRSISTLVNLLFLTNSIYDPQSGFKIYRVSDLLRNSIKLPFHTRWFGDVEIICRMTEESELQINEVPVKFWKDVPHGNLSLRHFFLIIRELITLFRYYRKRV